MQVVKLELYKNSEGHLVNNLGERVDELGRVTKARGAKGLGSRKKKNGTSGEPLAHASHRRREGATLPS